jgi:superfamily II DNA or RNA helicase
MKLRPYQRECVSRICEKLREGRSTVAVLATGLGKTVVFSEVIRLGLQRDGRRAIVLAHREELINQAADKVHAVTGLEPAIEMGEQRSIEDGVYGRSSVVISSIQTQTARWGDKRRMHRFRNDHPWLVVVDECHHAVSKSYRDVIEHYMQHPDSKLLGVTATPDRLDRRALGQVFESVSYQFDVADGIQQGWLVPVRQRFVQCDHLDLSAARKSAGDFQLNDLEEALEKSLLEMVAPMVEIVRDRRTLVFAATVKHAERIAEQLNRPGMKTGSAAIVHGGTPKDIRRQLFREYSEGKLQYLVNVAVATEGWDDPATDGRGVQVIAMMRPTQSRALYVQMLGRGTRSLPGVIDGIELPEDRAKAIAESAKASILVLDFLGNSGRHTLVHAGDVLGGSMDEPTSKRYRRESTKKGVAEEIDVLELISHSEREQRKAEEAKRRLHIVGRARFTTQDIDPFEALGIVPKSVPWWQRKIPATQKQRDMLERSGIRSKDLDTGMASQLIEALMSRPSEKQAWVIKRAGIDPTGLDRRSASEIITLIKGSRMDDARAIADRVHQSV